MFRTGSATGATMARQQFDVCGRGVGVAIIDSGITSWHDDLNLVDGTRRTADSVVHFKDFTNDANDGRANLPSDGYGHGTHVAGSIAGSGYDSDGARAGIAPCASLIALKVLDANGTGYISDVIAALDYAVANKDAFNIRVINLSVASGVFESYKDDPLTLAARRAVDAGIVVIASAGNLGVNQDGDVQYGGVTSPGNAPWVLTVGAASHQGTARRSDDTVGDFSSRGPTWIDFAAKPDLVAPGVGIESTADPYSTLYASHSAYLLDGTHDVRYKPYLSLSGTSMAAPVVAGIVTLMLEANPELTPNAVKAILQYTAQALAGESPLAQGAGIVNAPGAIRMARFFAAPRGGLGATSDSIEGESVSWSRQIIWGNFRVTGGVPLPGANAWATGLTWGAMKARKGAPVVWGARIVDKAVAAAGGADNIVWATRGRKNIVWATGDHDNIVWATTDQDNIVWATRGRTSMVWSTGDQDNIVWATGDQENIVWARRTRKTSSGRRPWRKTWSGVTTVAAAIASESFGAQPKTARCGVLPTTTTSCGPPPTSTTSCGPQPTPTTSCGRQPSCDNIVWATGGAPNIVWPPSAEDNGTTSDRTVWPAGMR